MDKWFVMLLMVLVAGMFSPIIVSENAKSACKVEAIKAGMPADDILKLCK